MSIQDIKNLALTEDAKMAIIADAIDGSGSTATLDKVLENGNTAVEKQITLKDQNNAQDRMIMSKATVDGSRVVEGGVASCQISSTGSLFLSFQADADGSDTYLDIRVDGGVPKVLMSDNMKAAFKAELGIS